MKKITASLFFILAAQTILFAQAIQRTYWTTNLLSAPSGISNIIDTSDIVYDKVYTNTSGSNLLVTASMAQSTTISGLILGGLKIDNNSDGTYETFIQCGGNVFASTGIYTNQVSGTILQNGRYYFTNSVGGGGGTDAGAIVSGSCQRVYSPAAQVIVSGVASAVPSSTGLMQGSGSGGLKDSGIPPASVVTNGGNPTFLSVTNTSGQFTETTGQFSFNNNSGATSTLNDGDWTVTGGYWAGVHGFHGDGSNLTGVNALTATTASNLTANALIQVTNAATTIASAATNTPSLMRTNGTGNLVTGSGLDTGIQPASVVTGASQLTNGTLPVTATPTNKYPVEIIRGTNSIFYTSLTNAVAAAVSGDKIQLLKNTIYDLRSLSSPLPIKDGVSLIGGDKESSVILYATNGIYITNNVLISDCYIICTNLYNVTNQSIFAALLAKGDVTNCIIRNMRIDTTANAIQDDNSFGTVSWTIEGCSIKSNQRGIYTVNTSGNPSAVSKIRNNTITVVDSSTIGVTTVGMSLSGTGTRFVSDNVIYADLNGATSATAREYIGYYSGSGTNYITNLRIFPLNDANGICQQFLNEGATVYCDASVADNQKILAISGQTEYPLGGDGQKIGQNEIYTFGPQVINATNYFYDIPDNDDRTIRFDNTTIPLFMNRFYQRANFFGLVTNFNFLPTGVTSSTIYMTNNGVAISINGTGGIYVTNFGYGNVLIPVTSNGSIFVTNLGPSQINFYWADNWTAPSKTGTNGAVGLTAYICTGTSDTPGKWGSFVPISGNVTSFSFRSSFNYSAISTLCCGWADQGDRKAIVTIQPVGVTTNVVTSGGTLYITNGIIGRVQ